jgi:HSP20 family protein
MHFVNWNKADPLDSITHIQREMGDLFDFLSSAPQAEGYVSEEFPQVILSTNKEFVIVRAELPGINAGDLDVQVVNDLLTIKGERKPTAEASAVTYLRRERDHGTFARSIMMPEKVDPDRVTASYKDGVLIIKLPKAQESKPKQVVIK